MSREISKENLDKFREIIYTKLSDDDIKDLYDAMDTNTVSVFGMTEAQDIETYEVRFDGSALPRVRRRNEVFNILRKAGLCTWKGPEIAQDNTAIVDFTWTGPLANTNSLPENGADYPKAEEYDLLAVGSGYVYGGGDLELPNQCTDIIACAGVIVKWKEHQIEDAEKLQTAIDTNKAWLVNGKIGENLEGPFPTRLSWSNTQIPVMVDEDKWQENLDAFNEITNDPKAGNKPTTVRIPYKVWEFEHGLQAAFLASKIRRGADVNEFLTAVTNAEMKSALTIQQASQSGSPDPSKAIIILSKIGILTSAREFNAALANVGFVQIFNTDSLHDTLQTARLNAQAWTYYNVVITADVLYNLYKFTKGIATGDFKMALSSGINLGYIAGMEIAKSIIKNQVYTAAGTTAAEASAAVVTEATLAANVLVWGQLISQAIVLAALFGYAYAEESALYDQNYKTAAAAGLEPNIFASTRGRVSVQGMAGDRVYSKTGQAVTAPWIYQKSDGTSLRAFHYPYGLDPAGVFSGTANTRFMQIYQQFVNANPDFRTTPAFQSSGNVIIPTDVFGGQGIPDVTRKVPFNNNNPKTGADSTPEPQSMLRNIYDIMGSPPTSPSNDFDPPTQISSYITEIRDLGGTNAENVNLTPINNSISYENMDSMLDTGIESLTARHRTHEWGNILQACVSLGQQMLIDDKSNIPPVDINTYPIQQTNLLSGNSEAKSLSDDLAANIWGQTGGGGPLANSCFPEYTKVLTPDGSKSIIEISVGDFVLSFDYKTGDVLPKKVTHKFIHDGKEIADIYRYTLSNGILLDITKNHSVFTENGEFKQIGKLNIGDKLIDIDDNHISIISCEFLKTDTVYNLEIEDFHTYFAESIKVHNALKVPADDVIGQGSSAFLAGSNNMDDGGSPAQRSREMKRFQKVRTQPKKTDDASKGTTDKEDDAQTAAYVMIYCFPEFSKVFTPLGNVRISNLKKGDIIFTYNDSGKIEESIVSKIISHIDDKQDVYKYTFSNNTVLYSTETHSVLTSNLEFIPICEVKIGESVKNVYNEDIELISIEYFDKVSVYSIFPEKNDTYIIDGVRVESGVLVRIDY